MSQRKSRDELRRSSIDTSQFIGLARLYARQGADERALHYLRAAEQMGLELPEPHRVRGELWLRRGRLEEATEELRRALTLDPFDGALAELLGLAEHRRGHYAEAAAATARAFLLVESLTGDDARRLRRRLTTLKRILNWQTSELRGLFEEVRSELDIALDRLDFKREAISGRSDLPSSEALDHGLPPPARGGALDLAHRLRQAAVLRELSDDQIYRLSSLARAEQYAAGEHIYSTGAAGSDLFWLESGSVRVERESPYGTYALRELATGTLFGEAALFGEPGREGDAVAREAISLLRLEARGLAAVLAAEPELASRFTWCLWRSLASKLRASNDQLRGIFTTLPAGRPASGAPRAAPGRAEELPNVDPPSEDTVQVLREQGLSQRDLLTFATFSREKRFAAGSYLFREGDPGDELYAVVEGRVLISKFIPGGGDEALALLGRGEFFGEMALIDGLPRSADARAESGPVTVLALDRATVHELLQMDPTAALDFLHLLCRLLARRLHEIEEKWIGWQILGGAPPLGQLTSPAPAAP